MRTQLWPVTLVSLALFAAAMARGQSMPASPPTSASPPAPTASATTSYDAVSIHEHAADDHSMMWRILPNGFNNANVTLSNIASGAYNIKLDLISGGPPWVYNKGFDFSAKVLPGDDGLPVQLTGEQRNALTRALLADRFHLQAHVETKILPTYDLVVAKGGVKMKAVPPPSTPSTPSDTPIDASQTSRAYSEFGPGYIRANAYAVDDLAQSLGYTVGKTVINQTGLTGKYDFTPAYTPNATPKDQPAQPTDTATSGADPKPDLFTALQEQLGLKLLPSKGPVRTLVIDHAEPPTAN